MASLRGRQVGSQREEWGTPEDRTQGWEVGVHVRQRGRWWQGEIDSSESKLSHCTVVPGASLGLWAVVGPAVSLTWNCLSSLPSLLSLTPAHGQVHDGMVQFTKLVHSGWPHPMPPSRWPCDFMGDTFGRVPAAHALLRDVRSLRAGNQQGLWIPPPSFPNLESFYWIPSAHTEDNGKACWIEEWQIWSLSLKFSTPLFRFKSRVCSCVLGTFQCTKHFPFNLTMFRP